MEILLLAFANSRERPLTTLADEYAALNKTLSPRVLRQHFLSWAISHATLDDIAYYLTLFRDRLSLFLYSGHAGRDALITEGGASRAGGIAHLLGQCSKLKVVVLNGCSTGGQVEALHKAGAPLVIATSAPIDDELATRFSMRLFQALETGLTIGEAFEQAIGEAKAIREVKEVRSVTVLDLSNLDAPTWGIFPNPDKEDVTGWKLPQQTARAVNTRFEPNDLLLETLYETLAKTNPAIKELYDGGGDLEEQKDIIVGGLLKALPAPISEQVRKLIAPSNPDAVEGWDMIGEMRLAQLGQAYQITMDFLVFTLMAQLWEMAFTLGDQWTPSPALRTELGAFLNLDEEGRRNCDYFGVIRTLREAFGDDPPKFFVAELDQLRASFLEDDNVKNACFFLETLRRQAGSAGMGEMTELCERAEKSLSDLFSKLGFLGKYILATVRNIDVQKYRHTEVAQFEHLVMKWHGSQGFFEREYRRQPEFMDNRSVVLLQVGPADNRFLNLSPFILDENTFEPTPDLSISKLYFFARRDKERLYYKYVNNPDTDVINLDDDEFYERKKKASKFKLAIDQFEAFYNRIIQPQTQPQS